MSSPYSENPYQASSYSPLVAAANEWERSVFIRRTYLHLAAAIGVFILLEFAAFQLTSPADKMRILGTMMSGWNWLIVLGAFMFVSWIAERWAVSSTSLTTQYAGLGLYVAAQAAIMFPLLVMADRYDGAIFTAGVMTGCVFGGLTAFIFFTRADLSGWGKWLSLAGFAALGLIVCSIFFPFQLGVLFTGFMVLLAGGYVLYHTSAVLHTYQTSQYVAASLALFASVAILFWYILRLVMFSSRD